MTIEQKHKLSRQIAAAIEKTEYYRNAIAKMKRHPKTFYEAHGEIRLLGNRSNIWVDFTIEEATLILKKKLKEAEKELENLTRKMK